YYVAAGQPEEAVREIGRARAIDPLSLIINTRTATMLMWARRYDAAAAQLGRTLELDSSYSLAHAELARAYLMLQRCPDAIREGEIGNALVGGYEGAILGYAYAACGDRARAERELNDKLETTRHHYVPADMIAKIYAGLGDKPRALDWLERAYVQHTWSLYLLQVEPMYDNLRREPRFTALVRKMHLR
ncbi:MAG: tetratricopeptide repeat protein, partial [Gaiellaceae bacterium]